MSSRALAEWQREASAAFDELEHAHRAVGGTGPGRRFVTQQVNYAYVMLLAARFQAFARELHTQTGDAVVAGAAANPTYEVLLRRALTRNRALERNNAQPNAIADDFGRFGFDVWAAIETHRAGNDERRTKLWRLIEWRNAIGHHDIDARLQAGTLVPDHVTFSTCRDWRRMLNVLARSLDAVAADQCEALGLARPW